jgi:hypothetical protein
MEKETADTGERIWLTVLEVAEAAHPAHPRL